ncbi:hypothetical protein SARC_17088, partial [Sphaeroforma arctica JP610]
MTIPPHCEYVQPIKLRFQMYQNKSYFEEERMPRKVLKLRHYSKCANSEDIHAAVGKYPFTIFPIDNETDSE